MIALATELLIWIKIRGLIGLDYASGTPYLENTNTSVVISDKARATNNGTRWYNVTLDMRICSNRTNSAGESAGNCDMLEFADMPVVGVKRQTVNATY